MKEVLEVYKIAELVRLALEEDIGEGDITTNRIIPQDMVVEADIVVKERGVICGLPVAEYIYSQIPLYPPLLKGGYGGICFTAKVSEGTEVECGCAVANVKGSAQALLTGERVVLNFLQRLSGIATITASFVKKVSRYNVQILDTRKTTPNLRYLEKYAVRVGGGKNHRLGLYDQILIKDNHLKCMPASCTIKEVVQAALEPHPDMSVEVEVEDLEQLKDALDADVDIIMLDNMDLPRIERAVKIVKGWQPAKGIKRPLIEVSGNVTLEMVEDIARTGVDRISIGALTHSVKALDISLEIR